MYTDLFKMCGYTDEEIEQERPRIEKTLERMGVYNEAAIKHAEETVQINYDIEMESVRKFLRVFMKSCVDAVLARDEHEYVINCNWPFPVQMTLAMMDAANENGDKAWVGMPVQIFWMVGGTIFDILTPVLERGELIGQPVGKAHCSQYQIYTGAIDMGILPKPDLAIGSGWFCDQAAETEEMMHELYGFEIFYLDGLNDWAWGSWPELDERAVKYSANTIKLALQRVKEIAGFETTEDQLREGFKYVAKWLYGMQNITRMVGNADPQPISQANVNLPYGLWAIATEYRDQAVDGLGTMVREVKRKVDEGVGVVPKGAPRVYLALRTNVDTTPIRMVESLGLALPTVFVDWLCPQELTKSKYTDMVEKIAEGLYRRPQLCDASASLEYWKTVCRDWNMDAAIIFYAYNCRPWAIPPIMAKKEIQKEIGVPAIVLEGDGYDTRNYNAEQLRTRLESFAEIVKMNKEMKAA
ncbi:MAG: 2-hydroxyacyl-CoA dehydratase family protein [Dehalococcoidia bacterium]